MTKKHFILTFLLIVGLLSGTGCSRKTDEVVASFGKHTITLSEFQTAYLELLKKPQVMDSPELREKFLDEMITWKLLADEARDMDIDKNEKYQYQVKAYREKCCRDLHFQEKIKPQIEISENLLREVFPYIKQQRHIKHLFFENEKEANLAYLRLADGLPWDTLAAQIFADTELANSGGDLGWVYWDQMEYDMGLEAFRLKVNDCSQPVSSTHGFHIIKVVDYKINPLIAEEDYQLHKDKTRYILEQKIGDKIATAYIKEMMADKKLEVRGDMMKLVGTRFKQIFTRQPKQFERIQEAQLNADEIQALETNFWDFRNNELVYIDGKTYTVGEFIYHLNYIPYAATASGFKTALDYFIRDKVLTDEAFAMKLDKEASAKLKNGLFEDRLLQTELKRRIVQGVTVNDDEIRRFMNDRKGSDIQEDEFNELRDNIYTLLMNEKKIDTISNYTARLREDLDIKKNNQLIHNYYDNLQKLKDRK